MYSRTHIVRIRARVSSVRRLDCSALFVVQFFQATLFVLAEETEIDTGSTHGSVTVVVVVAALRDKQLFAIERVHGSLARTAIL